MTDQMYPDGERSFAANAIQDLAPADKPAHIFRQGGVFLVGARSTSSGVPVFPPRRTCPETGATDMETALFGPGGTLYAFSTVHVSARQDTPYTIGYVDLPEGLRVLAQLRGGPWACDQPVLLRGDDMSWWVEPEAAA